MRPKTINRKQFMTVGEAAEFFDVNEFTVRAWFDKGELGGIRHPINNYRLIDRNAAVELGEKLQFTKKHLKTAGASNA